MSLAQLYTQLFAHLRAIGEQQSRAVARLPRWRHPFVGYGAGLVLVGCGLGIGLVEARLLTAIAFPGLLLLFSVVLVALFWSVGPALFTILLSIVVLDYLYVPPLNVLGSYGWTGLIQLFTFAVVGIIIAVLTNQREMARLQALEAREEAMMRTHELEATFDAMSDGVVVYDKHGRVLQTNTATRSLFGIQAIPRNEQAQKEQALLLQAAQYDEQGEPFPVHRQPLTRLLRGETLTGSKATDVLVQTLDGRKVMFNLSGSAIHGVSENTGDARSIERAVVIYRDVTERRRLERRTTEALQALLAMAQTLVQFPYLTHPVGTHFPTHPVGTQPTHPIGTQLTHPVGTQFIASEETAINEREPSSITTSVMRQVGQQLVELAMSVVESMHVALLSIEPDEETVSLVTAAGFTTMQEQQWRERLAHESSLVDALGNERLVPYLKEDEVLLLDGMSLPLYTSVLPYYVQTVLVVPVRAGTQLIGLLCLDDGSREHSYTASEMTLAQTVARLLSLLFARRQLEREYTEAQADARALRETNRRMQEFLSIICHELKTPLTILQGSLQLAERKVKRLIDEEQSCTENARQLLPLQTLLERGKSQVAVQTRLVNDLLDVSRTQAQTLHLSMSRSSLIQIVQQAVVQQRQVADGRTIDLELPTEQEVSVYVDAERLMQVMTNFLSNALKYSPSEQPVVVSVQVEQEQVRVTVCDKGPGIPLAEQQRIWERFYRVRNIRIQSGTESGLGVGLYLCRTIIERHNGHVGVVSQPGQGAAFWFTLPLAENEEHDENEEMME